VFARWAETNAVLHPAGDPPEGGRTDPSPMAVVYRDKVHLFAGGADDRKIYVNVGALAGFKWTGWSKGQRMMSGK
jgi:hypothetical protein